MNAEVSPNECRGSALPAARLETDPGAALPHSSGRLQQLKEALAAKRPKLGVSYLAMMPAQQKTAEEKSPGALQRMGGSSASHSPHSVLSNARTTRFFLEDAGVAYR